MERRRAPAGPDSARGQQGSWCAIWRSIPPRTSSEAFPKTRALSRRENAGARVANRLRQLNRQRILRIEPAVAVVALVLPGEARPDLRLRRQMKQLAIG